MKNLIKINGREWVFEDELFHKVQRLPVTVLAIQINEPFEVDTLEGTMKGNPGDWLIKGVESELYPCKDSVFRKTYKSCNWKYAK